MKDKLRKDLKLKRQSLDYNYVMEYSLNVSKKFLKTLTYKESNVVMSYMAIKNEVEMSFIHQKILENKRLILPKINDLDQIIPVEITNLNDFELGKYDILEPVGKKIDKKEIDLVIVPGVAFDKKGNRIGFGKGYYDRFLKEINAKKVAIIYPFQLVDEIKREKHDINIEEIYVDFN